MPSNENSNAARLNWNRRQGQQISQAAQVSRNQGQVAGKNSAIASAAQFADSPLKSAAGRLNVLKNSAAAKNKKQGATKAIAKTALKIVIKKALLTLALWALGILLWLLPWILIGIVLILTVIIILPSVTS